MHPHSPPPLFPYTTLFRSANLLEARRAAGQPRLERVGEAGGTHERPQRGSRLARLESPWASRGETKDESTPHMPWPGPLLRSDRKSTRLNSSHGSISYAVF